MNFVFDEMGIIIYKGQKLEIHINNIINHLKNDLNIESIIEEEYNTVIKSLRDKKINKILIR